MTLFSLTQDKENDKVFTFDRIKAVKKHFVNFLLIS